MAARHDDIRRFNNLLIAATEVRLEDIANMWNSGAWKKQIFQRALRWGLVVELSQSYVDKVAPVSMYINIAIRLPPPPPPPPPLLLSISLSAVPISLSIYLPL